MVVASGLGSLLLLGGDGMMRHDRRKRFSTSKVGVYRIQSRQIAFTHSPSLSDDTKIPTTYFIFQVVFESLPTPLAENHFSKKNLSGNGGYPPPLLTENRRKFSSENGTKRAKISVFWPKIAVFSGFFP